ncbi:hypothetical protein BJ508DRAFT_312882 [Ascobolus immersus RN42]|uniref:Uncharacterized protein n=1 Tax=Ascobolus immersus RN42 TaxID=1160509 RepID=A0A3N4HKR9_ASCIM|nr:hypothetical protein BJ508DRAFT_312882 [Ascobolus immersus RN42]
MQWQSSTNSTTHTPPIRRALVVDTDHPVPYIATQTTCSTTDEMVEDGELDLYGRPVILQEAKIPYESMLSTGGRFEKVDRSVIPLDPFCAPIFQSYCSANLPKFDMRSRDFGALAIERLFPLLCNQFRPDAASSVMQQLSSVHIEDLRVLSFFTDQLALNKMPLCAPSTAKFPSMISRKFLQLKDFWRYLEYEIGEKRHQKFEKECIQSIQEEAEKCIRCQSGGGKLGRNRCIECQKGVEAKVVESADKRCQQADSKSSREAREPWEPKKGEGVYSSARSYAYMLGWIRVDILGTHEKTSRSGQSVSPEVVLGDRKTNINEFRSDLYDLMRDYEKSSQLYAKLLVGDTKREYAEFWQTLPRHLAEMLEECEMQGIPFGGREALPGGGQVWFFGYISLRLPLAFGTSALPSPRPSLVWQLSGSPGLSCGFPKWSAQSNSNIGYHPYRNNLVASGFQPGGRVGDVGVRSRSDPEPLPPVLRHEFVVSNWFGILGHGGEARSSHFDFILNRQDAPYGYSWFNVSKVTSMQCTIYKFNIPAGGGLNFKISFSKSSTMRKPLYFTVDRNPHEYDRTSIGFQPLQALRQSLRHQPSLMPLDVLCAWNTKMTIGVHRETWMANVYIDRGLPDRLVQKRIGLTLQARDPDKLVGLQHALRQLLTIHQTVYWNLTTYLDRLGRCTEGIQAQEESDCITNMIRLLERFWDTALREVIAEVEGTWDESDKSTFRRHIEELLDIQKAAAKKDGEATSQSLRWSPQADLLALQLVSDPLIIAPSKEFHREFFYFRRAVEHIEKFFLREVNEEGRHTVQEVWEFWCHFKELVTEIARTHFQSRISHIEVLGARFVKSFEWEWNERHTGKWINVRLKR